MNVIVKRLACLQCDKELSKGQKKFCCSSCAATYNNFHRSTTTKGKKKRVLCKYCNQTIYKSVHVSPQYHICDDCKRRIKFNKCRFCGKSVDGIQYCSDECKHYHYVYKTLVKYTHIDPDCVGTSKALEEINRIRDFLYDLYWNKEITSGEICKIIDCPVTLFADTVLKDLFIKTRSVRQAIKLNYLKGVLSPRTDKKYKMTWHTTWNNKQVFLRSSYELKYAEQLDEQQIDYDVENLRIKYFDTQQNEYRCAIPDFYIPSTNTIVEIKSNWTYDEQNMKDRFKAYGESGYNTKLILDFQETPI